MSVYRKIAKFSVFAVMCFGLTACSSKPKYQWQTANGSAATMGQIKKTKTSCKFDKRLEKAANQIITALILNKKTVRKVASKKHLKRADKTLASIKGCMAAKGLKRVKT